MSKQIEEARQGLAASELGHVDEAAPEQTPGYVLLPGDPNRVAKMAAQWDSGARMYTLSRGQTAAVGTYRDVPLGAWSTGIGGPSTECVLTDLAARGTHTFIRVGTTGAIQEDIRIGDIIINDSNVRLDGTSRLYVREGVSGGPPPMRWCWLWCRPARIWASGTTWAPVHLRLFLHRPVPHQLRRLPALLAGRPVRGSAPGRRAELRDGGRHRHHPQPPLRQAAAMCASVVAQRITGQWDETPQGENNACLVGAEAIRILTEWDRKKAEQGKQYYFPGL